MKTRMFLVLLVTLSAASGCRRCVVDCCQGSGGLFGSGWENCGATNGPHDLREADKRWAAYPCGDLWACYCPCNTSGCCPKQAVTAGPDCCNPYMAHKPTLQDHPHLEPTPSGVVERAPSVRPSRPAMEKNRSHSFTSEPASRAQEKAQDQTEVDDSSKNSPLDTTPAPPAIPSRPSERNDDSPSEQTPTNDHSDVAAPTAPTVVPPSFETSIPEASAPSQDDAEADSHPRPPRNVLPSAGLPDRTLAAPTGESSRRTWRSSESATSQSQTKLRKPSVAAMRNYLRRLQK